jgi:hypothetical protein
MYSQNRDNILKRQRNYSQIKVAVVKANRNCHEDDTQTDNQW